MSNEANSDKATELHEHAGMTPAAFSFQVKRLINIHYESQQSSAMVINKTLCEYLVADGPATCLVGSKSAY